MDEWQTQEIVYNPEEILEVDETEILEDQQCIIEPNPVEHLDDYLDSLTCSPSTSINLKVAQVSDKNRRSSVPALEGCKSETRIRNPSSSSDKVYRTRGSTFLDSYLGQLTDSSWLSHPILPKKQEVIQKIPAENKVTFIDVDSFYDRSPGPSGSDGAQPLVVCEPISESHSNTHESTSPSISSSIFDHDTQFSSPHQKQERNFVYPIQENLDSGLQEVHDSENCLNSTFTEISGGLQDSGVHLGEGRSIFDTQVPGHVCQQQEIHQDETDTIDRLTLGASENRNDLDIDRLEFPLSNSENSSITEMSTIVSYTVNETRKSNSTEVTNDPNACTIESQSTETILQSSSPSSKTLDETVSLKSHTKKSSLLEAITILKNKHEIELEQLLHSQQEELKTLIAEYRSNSYMELANDQSELTNRSADLISVQSNCESSHETSLPSASSGDFSRPKDSFFLHKSPDSLDSVHERSGSSSRQISLLFKGENTQPVSMQQSSSLALQKKNNCSLNKDTSQNSSHRENPDTAQCLWKVMPNEFNKKFEVGLDLIPAREKDLDIVNGIQLTPLQLRGICKMQALVRGQRIRRMMATSQVQQILATLGEVAKLARQFHKDILSDNIKKGDVDFHRALFTQEKQAREKLWQLLVGMSPVEQTEIIAKDREMKKRAQARKVDIVRVNNTLSASNQPISPKAIATVAPHITKSISSQQLRRPMVNTTPKFHLPNYKPPAKKIPRRSPSEPQRLCQTQRHSKLPVSTSQENQTPQSKKRWIPRSLSHSDKIKIPEGRMAKEEAHTQRGAGKENVDKTKSTPQRKQTGKPTTKIKAQWR